MRHEYAKNNKAWIFSPQTFLVLVSLTYFLTFVENELGWGRMAHYEQSENIAIFLIYITSFALGILLTKVRKKEKFILGELKTDEDDRNIWIFIFLASFFQIAKFINIGDIPLLGDPASRYKMTLGGFEDYPSRLLAPLSILFFYKYLESRRNSSLIGVGICLLLPSLLMQRQEVMISIIGCAMLFVSRRKINNIKIILYSAIVVSAAVFVIGYLGVIRFGREQLSQFMSLPEIMVWMIHGEITSPIKFGEFVYENTSRLNGYYTFGELISIVYPGLSEHGAELIKRLHTNSETAQSIGLYYGFAVDFGLIGVAFFSTLSGLILSLGYGAWRRNTTKYIAVMYPLLFCQILWSIRSGVFLLSPLLVYQGMAMYVLLKVSDVWGLLRFIKPLFYLTILISLIGLIVRI